ncbi:MAG TPA: acyl-CoA dehydrogenase family protein [Casimicrobiaceae bacterium]|nr:acyl-CoA dehydrogenase family protein [Casimicrobiaceae bacterium]
MIRDPDAFDAFLAVLRRFVRERLVPLEARVADEDAIPHDLVDEMRALGLFGLSIPEAYGGAALTMEEEVLAVLELGRTSPAFRSMFGTNVGIGSQGLILAGTDEQKQRWLPRLASGELIASFALTEPDAGSDAASLTTRAVADGDAYVLNGAKRYITNAPEAGLFTVMARTGAGGSGASGISAFLVEAGTPGLSIGPPDRKMGQRGAHTADVVLADCRVPAANRLGAEGEGFRIAMQVLDKGRLHIAALCVAVAERMLDDALGYALERRQFGTRIADFQLVQALLADSRAEALAGRTMVLETSRRRDRGESVTVDASCCKLFASEMCGRVADRAVQVFGGAGYIADAGIERFYRDVRLFRLYEGTSQIQQLVIARGMIREREGR